MLPRNDPIRQKIMNKKLAAARMDKGPWKIAGHSLAKLVAPIIALQPVTIPTSRELNRRALARLKD